MFFGSRKVKIAKAVVARIAPHFTGLERIIGPLPPQLIYDPYVLGYLTANIMIFTQITSGSRVTTEEHGFIFYEVVKSIFAQNAPTISALASFSEMHQTDPDFLRGAKAAEKILSTMAGFPNFMNDPDVLTARAALSRAGQDLESLMTFGASENSKIASLLQYRLFYRYVMDHYGNN